MFPSRLKAQYLRYNRRWFGNTLPTDVTCRWAWLWRTLGDYGDDELRINVLLYFFPNMLKSTMLHEMAHVATEDERQDHGPRWRRQMRRLARIGAFDNLW